MIKQHPASYKDPAGYIFLHENRVYRVVTSFGAEDFYATRAHPVFERLIAEGILLPEHRLSLEAPFQGMIPDAVELLEHPKIPLITYPYEWTFSGLKDAALLHLKIQQDLLANNMCLSDASAYNIQFQGAKPIFIDHLSFKIYQEGEYWLAHQQFCEQFLNPLLLSAYCQIDFQPLYRGTMGGISSKILRKALPWYRWSFNTLCHVILPDYWESKPKKLAIDLTSQRPFHRTAYRQLLTGLAHWIERLNLPHAKKTCWANYAKENTYQEMAKQQKIGFIQSFVQETGCKHILDLGCNSGDYAIAALAAGATSAIGIDSDIGALEQAYQRAKKDKLNFLPLYGNCADPSPAQGFLGKERESFQERVQVDAVFSLALIHHLAFKNNLSIKQIIDYLLSLAPLGVVEFIPKTDPMVQLMLSLRQDHYTHYSYNNFIDYLSQKATIIKIETISQSDRILIGYQQ
jgi:ribosomal protein L11 methylase PrmA